MTPAEASAEPPVAVAIAFAPIVMLPVLCRTAEASPVVPLSGQVLTHPLLTILACEVHHASAEDLEMNRNSTLPILLSALGLGAALAPPVHADAWDKKTFVTFSQSVEVPGTVLPAGKYVFKLVDSLSDRHIVRITNERENKVYATILAIPAYRMEPADHSIFTFHEMPAGQPEALNKWFYPGDNYGQEFRYSKKRAAEIALAMQQTQTVAEVAKPVVAEVAASSPVITAEDDLQAAILETTPQAPEIATVPVVPSPSEELNPEAPVPSDDDDSAEAAPAPEPPQPPTTPSDASNNELPKTASQLYLTGLLGLLATLGALGVRQYRRAL